MKIDRIIELEQKLARIRNNLEKVWSINTAHEDYRQDNENNISEIRNSSKGQCYVSCLITYMELEDFYPKIIRGELKNIDKNHYWLEIEDYIIDVTADQFPKMNLPKVLFGKYEDHPYYIKYSIDTSFSRFLELYRKYKKLK